MAPGLHASQAARPSRLYSDAIHLRLLSRWWPATPVCAALKSDLFEEACGDGLVPLLLERSERVLGIDLSAATAARARARHPRVEAVCADVRDLPFRDASFDLVVSSSTLDHFAVHREIDASLAELGRVLRPGGRLVLTLDNPLHPPVALRNAAPALWRALRLVPYRVGVTLGPRGLERALGRARLRPLEIGAVMHFPRLLAEIATPVLAPSAGPRRVRLLAALLRFERLERWPTRFLTGQFVAAAATRG